MERSSPAFRRRNRSETHLPPGGGTARGIATPDRCPRDEASEGDGGEGGARRAGGVRPGVPEGSCPSDQGVARVWCESLGEGGNRRAGGARENGGYLPGASRSIRRGWDAKDRGGK